MPSRFLWLGFGGAQKKFKFHAFEDEILEGKFDAMFEPFPFTSGSPEPLFALPHEPQINNIEGLPQKFPFPDVLAWGNGIDTDSSVFFTGFHGEGHEQKRFCVKVLFNIDKTEEDDNCYKAIDNMLADAKFYGRNLRASAGVLVPRHYGVWRARTGKWGGTVLCSITEWAGTGWNQVVAAGRDTTGLKTLVGRTIERLHDRGVHHNRLLCRSDLHHILFRVDQTDAGPITRCFVIDFSKAMTNPCTRNLPILPLDAAISPQIGGCRETSNVMFLLGMLEQDVTLSSSTRTYKALRFHKQYSALHPSLDNATVLMVQRHHFFEHDPPLEPDIKFGFLPDGKVVFDMKDSDKLAKRLPEKYIASLSS